MLTTSKRALAVATATAALLGTGSTADAGTSPPNDHRRKPIACTVCAMSSLSGIAPGAITTSSPAQPVALVAGQGAGDVNRTAERFAVYATDLGVMWTDSRGTVSIAFGDSYGAGWGGHGAGPATADWRFDTLAHSSDTALADGLRIDSMITDRPGHAAQILPPDPQAQEMTVIPTAGVGVDHRDYLHYMSVHSWGADGDWVTNYAGLAYSDDGGQTWMKPSGSRWPNQLAGRVFQQGALARDNGFVYLFGTPNGRHGDAYLARVAESQVLDLPAYQYWTATGWRSDASEQAVPVMAGPVGELSVQFNAYLGRWVALYLDEARAAIVLRTATGPTGPWTGGQDIADGVDYPGLYGAFQHPASAAGADLYFAMSQWEPYHVELMRLPLTTFPINPNLLQDGGFEDRAAASCQRLGAWLITGRGGIDCAAGMAHSGANNAWVRNTTGWNDVHQKVAVQPGKRYRLSGWLRSSDTTTDGHFGVRLPNGGAVAEQEFGHLNDYTRLDVEFTADSATELEVYAGERSMSGKDVWTQLDDVTLEQLPG